MLILNVANSSVTIAARSDVCLV